ncbi:cytochrome c oxidase subunit 7A2, mitochondrial [Hippoglossus hippoglossus]|uniref:cytochrome c oxidase subunit 7A2, mitochondrial n=1 Tax=Hippoglossus hippoglossus TaxID=8267 RepID=UPI00148B7473|nr:cytochrome c oxidase subunit 7A2, mitochondrial [Hippoglossus hippoglossus]XP_034999477.1 cytochrome c oxidase subunit 7A2, mitochondrial [Hippoglossus stenolepis]
MFRHVLALRQVARRSFSSSTRREMKNSVPEKQKIFQEDNGLPVHLKGGTSDALLYRATMTLTVLGTGFVLYELWKAAVPQKK